MLKVERITRNIEKNTELIKKINKESYYTVDQFINDVNSYINAVKDGRILYNVERVSQSGMSRLINVMSCEKADKNYYRKYYYRTYCQMFLALGYNVNKKGLVRVSGCGMDMRFATNYDLIMTFFNKLGFINKKQCETLRQMVVYNHG